MSENWLQRGEVLMGSERQQRLRDAHILVVGLGGVGSWAAEMLCRAGVGRFTLIDADTVDVTNINRQMPATHSTVGQMKVDVVAKRLKDINPQVEISSHALFVNAENIHGIIAERFTFVVDAIDTIPSKAALIVECWRSDTKIISALGAGAKCDLALIRQGDLWRSEQCTLAKNLRRALREYRGRYKLPVVFSMEPPMAEAIKPNPNGGKPIIGSIGYVTATFGCYMVEYVIKNI